MMESNELDVNELQELKAAMAQRLRRADFGQFEGQIRELMRQNISLPVIQWWLSEKRGLKTTVSALRRYVVRTFGQDQYSAYVDRNGWKKVGASSALNNALSANYEKNIFGNVNNSKDSSVSMDGVTTIQQILSAPPTRYPPRKR